MNRAFANLRSLAVCASLAAPACTSPHAPPPADSPAAAVESFARALQESDASAAWALLSKRTQAEADALAARARGAGDAGPDSGRAMLFGGALPLGAVMARELASDGGAAVVSVALDGGAARSFEVVREAEGWRLELKLTAAEQPGK